MSNCAEYVEAMIGSYRARAVPININHHYHPAEIASLLDQLHVEAVVYHRGLGHLLSEFDLRNRPLLVVDDDSDVDALAGSVPFEEAVTTEEAIGGLPTPSPDDLYLITTGGTTGPPKGVLWRQADVYVSGMGGVDGVAPEELAASAQQQGSVWFAPSPLMHSAGQRTVFASLLRGGTAVLHDDRTPFNAADILVTAERERVNLMSIVGDSYARALIDVLRERHYDLSALQVIGTGGATTGPTIKQELLDLLPQVTILDTFSSSETGGMARAASSRDQQGGAFGLTSDAAVISADRTRALNPGDDEIGWIARRGRIPLGYLDDPVRTADTFPVIAGGRYSIPGDRAKIAADGSIELLGRDSNVINTGGEKVFVEEVESALRTHPGVFDAVVLGRPSERFGTEIVAVVQTREGSNLTAEVVREHVASSIARFKAPRSLVFCEQLRRLASGKADYRWAREVVAASSPTAATRVTRPCTPT